jgi:3-hydroxyisobutyrate dehydrogenase-like beta-hydroxyacid dehydrogenase
VKPSIGLIGLGLMGRPMGANLLKAGYPLTVWNRTPVRAENLVKQGARLAASPREVAAASGVLFTIVSDPPALEEVMWGKDGALGGLRRGAIYVDSSTVSPALARRIAGECAERGVRFLDAPVTGGTWGAEKGELVFMVGGELATLKEVEPILSAMGKRWFHLGQHGAGQTIKLAMNLILALQVEALAEAIALVTAAGLPGEKLVEVLQSSMAQASWT